MIDYYIYLLKDFNSLPNELLSIKNLFNVDNDAAKLLVNTVLDTELKSFIVNLIDYKQEKYPDVNSLLDLILLDSQLASNVNMVSNEELKNYCRKHFSPLWRVAAFVCYFIIEADKYYHANIT